MNKLFRAAKGKLCFVVGKLLIPEAFAVTHNFYCPQAVWVNLFTHRNYPTTVTGQGAFKTKREAIANGARNCNYVCTVKVKRSRLSNKLLKEWQGI